MLRAQHFSQVRTELAPRDWASMATLSELQFVEAAPALVPDAISPLVARMRLMLSSLKPRSDAEALKLLRTSFPQSTLSERLSALSSLPR